MAGDWGAEARTLSPPTQGDTRGAWLTLARPAPCQQLLGRPVNPRPLHGNAGECVCAARGGARRCAGPQVRPASKEWRLTQSGNQRTQGIYARLAANTCSATGSGLCAGAHADSSMAAGPQGRPEAAPPTWGSKALPVAVGHHTVEHVGPAALCAGQEQWAAAVLLAHVAEVVGVVACSSAPMRARLTGYHVRGLPCPQAWRGPPPAARAACPSAQPCLPAQISVFHGWEKLVGPSSRVQVGYVSSLMLVCGAWRAGRQL